MFVCKSFGFLTPAPFSLSPYVIISKSEARNRRGQKARFFLFLKPEVTTLMVYKRNKRWEIFHCWTLYFWLVTFILWGFSVLTCIVKGWTNPTEHLSSKVLCLETLDFSIETHIWNNVFCIHIVYMQCFVTKQNQTKQARMYLSLGS